MPRTELLSSSQPPTQPRTPLPQLDQCGVLAPWTVLRRYLSHQITSIGQSLIWEGIWPCRLVACYPAMGGLQYETPTTTPVKCNKEEAKPCSSSSYQYVPSIQSDPYPRRPPACCMYMYYGCRRETETHADMNLPGSGLNGT